MSPCHDLEYLLFLIQVGRALFSMQESAKTKSGAETSDDEVQLLREKIERQTRKLEASQKELLEKENALSSLMEELKTLREGNLPSDKRK